MVAEILTARRVIEVLDQVQLSRPRDLRVVWLTVVAERQSMADEFKTLRDHRRIWPYVLRDPLFANPNAVLRDVLKVLEELREEIVASSNRQGGICIIVLSKHPLGIPQQSSMVPAPDWMPDVGGRLIDVPVEEFGWIGLASLADEEARIPELKSALFELELALVRLLRARQLTSPETVSALWVYMRLQKETGRSLEQFLANAEARAGAVSSPDAFRPYLKDGVAGRLASVVGAGGPWSSGQALLALAAVVGSEVRTRQPESCVLSALLSQPGQQPQDPGVRFAREIVTLCFFVFRWIGLSGHAAEFGQYPVGLLSTLSRHLVIATHECSRDIRDVTAQP